MSLGVLNNLSAMSAAHNLSNTQSSLSKTLEQLSSGSKINSGADDAAGLSLVNGLQANATALSQSQTNATEGVGLLTVADGALSQVTNLLNRAVTLATEVSNGTLNGSQNTAANQEYQSILSEINNIGATTTYNQKTVFGSNTGIYTGDSSTTGASVNQLNIRSLSSANVGDSSGAMAYSNGTNNVFINLSKGGTNAAVTDSLGLANATTSVQVNYMAKGADGSAVQASANISVGAGTSYTNTAQGLISAINGSGLGLTATFGTASQAGSAAVSAALAANTGGGGGTDTGIIISAAGVGTGTNGAGEVGSLVQGTAGNLVSGTLTIAGADGTTHNITLGTANSTDTLANLASTINAAGYGVTASVNSAPVGNQAANTVLTLTSANAGVTVGSANLVDSTSATDMVLKATPITTGQFNNTISTIVASAVNSTFGTAATSTLTIGSNAAIALGTAQKTDTLQNLTATINAGNYGVTAAYNTTSKTMTINSANASDTITWGAGTAAAATNITSFSTNVANQNQIGTVTLAGADTGATAFTSGALVIGGATFTGGAGGLNGIITSINSSNLGITASLNGSVMTMVANTTAAKGLTFTNNLTTGGGGATTSQVDTPAIGNSAYYSIGITSSSLTDTSIAGSGLANVGIVADNNGSGGLATISYSDSAGQSLANTDLTNSTSARATLTALNSAIAAVAAQDGYIGAQINTLNAVSSVMSTQQQNIVAAQNAVQATDYATAASNMSKYQILSQTGISALAQANSAQQAVLKLLQ